MVFKGKIPSPDFVGISNSRQLDILRRLHEEVRQAIDAVKSKVSMDCVAIYVRSSIEAIGEITGDTITEEALDKIFAEFCIGK